MRIDVILAGAPVVLLLPVSATERVEIVRAAVDTTRAIRVRAAAIGAAWADPKTRPAADYDGDVGSYGKAVADVLITRGCTWVEIVQAGTAVIEAIHADGIPGLAMALEASHPTPLPLEGTPSTG